MARRSILARNFLFRALSADQQRTLEGRVTTRVARPGELVFEQGDPGDAMYLIRSGEVAVEADGQELVRLGAGYHFGEIALVDGYPRSASIRATEETVLLVLLRDDFIDVLHADPVVAATVYRNFTYYLATRLRKTTTMAAQLKAQIDESESRP